MKLPERLGRRKGRGFHSAIATSFAVEFAAVEEVMLPQLMGSGATNILLIADERMVSLSLSDGSALPLQLGRDYALYSPPVASGVFHPKIILQLGRDGGRAFVSSANATAAGLAGNVEISTEIECSNEPNPEQDFIRSVWRYLERTTRGAEGAARDAMDWARERTPWLSGNEPGALQALPDESLLGFLAVPSENGILERFAEFLGGADVERLLILSPYWDDQLGTIADFRAMLAPRTTTILLDAKRHVFPRDAGPAASLEIIDISDWRGSRFKHAKLFVASTADHDHVLSGSANATPAALGRAGFHGTNAEACVYRRLPAGSAVQALGLGDIIARDATPAGDLPLVDHREPIPLGAVGDRRPGRFEVEYGALFWSPSKKPDWSGATVELLGPAGELLANFDANGLLDREGRKVIACDADTLAKTHFARLTLDGISSTLAPVIHRGVIKGRRREPVSGRIARSAAQFDDALGMELFLLEAFEDLYAADTIEPDAMESRIRPVRQQREQEGTDKTFKVLSYDEFMDERKAGRAGIRSGENALAGTHCDGVRALLNRLSGGNAEPVPEHRDDGNWMDLGDETGDLEADRSAPVAKTEPEPVSERVADRVAFERAVRKYTQNLATTKQALGAADVLKLRLLLMTILWNAKCPEFSGGLTCSVDEHGWPRLATRAIVAFFAGKDPPIRRLVLSSEFLEMPADFLECWTTVLWTVDAIAVTLPKAQRNKDFLSRIPALKALVVTRLGLTADELAGPIAINRAAGLDRELGRRIGLAAQG
ncbi:MAG: hypothetical protein ACOYLK_03100 [Sphingomonas sp.]